MLRLGLYYIINFSRKRNVNASITHIRCACVYRVVIFFEKENKCLVVVRLRQNDRLKGVRVNIGSGAILADVMGVDAHARDKKTSPSHTNVGVDVDLGALCQATCMGDSNEQRGFMRQEDLRTPRGLSRAPWPHHLAFVTFHVRSSSSRLWAFLVAEMTKDAAT